MTQRDWAKEAPDRVLNFWFSDTGHGDAPETHREFWQWRMTGQADEIICRDFADLTHAAVRGGLDHWAETPYGRLALIIARDQFPRSVWRDTPQAFAQDPGTNRLIREALANGHYDALKQAWEKQFCIIAITHCEGPDHLERMNLAVDLGFRLADEVPENMRVFYQLAIDQAMLVRDVIARFGRHPHRNAVLGRMDTTNEVEYLAAGQFPHQRDFPQTQEEIEALLRKRGII
ncbi:MAG: DUF924 domain-containing protein [Rhodobacteraceae bacterium]|nr:DUF924 domain-containing protein [Paracoccaceae bacterium]